MGPKVRCRQSRKCARGSVSAANWGRWGKDDQRGAMNLVTPEKAGDRGAPRQERPERLAEPAVFPR